MGHCTHIKPCSLPFNLVSSEPCISCIAILCMTMLILSLPFALPYCFDMTSDFDYTLDCVLKLSAISSFLVPTLTVWTLPDLVINFLQMDPYPSIMHQFLQR